jgi:hypothetical protein
MVERDNLIRSSMYKHDRRVDRGCIVNVGKLVTVYGAASFNNDAIDRKKGRMQDDSSNWTVLASFS